MKSEKAKRKADLLREDLKDLRRSAAIKLGILIQLVPPLIHGGQLEGEDLQLLSQLMQRATEKANQLLLTTFYLLLTANYLLLTTYYLLLTTHYLLLTTYYLLLATYYLLLTTYYLLLAIYYLLLSTRRNTTRS